MFGMQLPSYAEVQEPNCARRNFRNMLTPFQVVSNSNSKVFGRLNLLQCLLMQRVVKVYLIASNIRAYRNVATISYMCSSARYNTHLYRPAVQAGFYSDAVECRISTQEILVRPSAGAKGD